MPLRLEIKKELSARSDRVKSVDIFPAENPWVLSALYNGKVYIWDYSNNTLCKSFELCDVPVRCAKFIVRKQWFVAGTDDMHLRVYNYNTMEKVKEWEAHNDYIRHVEVHPNRPYILSACDDMTIKLWDWEKDFECIQTFEGHVHYVMMIKINPRDTNTFASASLDRSIKVWGLTAGSPHFSLEGHEKGVNCIDYYPGGDKPYLLSGADDRTVKIWDYQTKACLQTLEGHQHNVSAVCFHPRLPLIISASEDGTVRLWHSTTYRPETTLNYGLERAWALAPTKDANKLAIGYDEGTVVIKLGNEKPVASLDANTGKLVWAQSHDIQTMTVKSTSKDTEPQDGEKITLPARDLGSCEVYPQSLEHNSNGSFIVVCGDGEYIIYTSQALRNKAFGSALDFVWSSHGTGDYAIRESISRVRTFKNFKDHKQIALPMSTADGIFGGHCLGVKGSESIVFFDWESGDLIRKIDVSPIAVYWNSAGDTVILVCKDMYYVLRFNAALVAAGLAAGGSTSDEGIEGSFELENTISERIRTAQWVGDCLLYTNGANKLNYYVGGEVMTLCHLNQTMYLLGYVPKEDRVFLISKSYNVVSYKLLLSVLNYQTCVVRKDFESANSILPSIPKSEYNAVARFLESQGFKEEALTVTMDPDHKFELAIDLRKMDIARAVLTEISSREEDSTEANNRWRRLGDLALANGDIELSKSCAKLSGDLSGLLLLYSASGDREGLKSLAEQAVEVGRSNVAFLAYFVTGQVEKCIKLLIETGRIPEAAFLARTYMPSMISSVLELWRADLKQINEKAAEALADPAKYPNLFPDLEWALKVEDIFSKARDAYVPALSYPTARLELDLDLIEIIKAQKLASPEPEPVAVPAAVVHEVIVPDVESDDEVVVTPEPKSPPRSPVSRSPVASPTKPALPMSQSHSPVFVKKEPIIDQEVEALINETSELLSVQTLSSSPVKSSYNTSSVQSPPPAYAPPVASNTSPDEEEDEDDDSFEEIANPPVNGNSTNDSAAVADDDDDVDLDDDDEDSNW